jgi:hypothetical protein
MIANFLNEIIQAIRAYPLFDERLGDNASFEAGLGKRQTPLSKETNSLARWEISQPFSRHGGKWVSTLKMSSTA